MLATKQTFDFIGDMKEIYKGGRRFYLTPEGRHYPSVTTVLASDDEKNEGLAKWREAVGDEEADRVSRVGRLRGSALHDMIEKYLLGNENYDANIMPGVDSMFSSIKPILDGTITDIAHQEVAMYSDYLETGGRCDMIAKYKGKLAIVDFKNSRKFRKKEFIKSYFMQCAVYAVMYEELTGTPINDIIIIMAVENRPEGVVYHEKRDDHIGDYIELRKEYEKTLNPNYISRFAA